jgi:hypothetical protein
MQVPRDDYESAATIRASRYTIIGIAVATSEKFDFHHWSSLLFLIGFDRKEMK